MGFRFKGAPLSSCNLWTAEIPGVPPTVLLTVWHYGSKLPSPPGIADSRRFSEERLRGLGVLDRSRLDHSPLLISKSTNRGSSFGSPVTISSVVETGDGKGLQGGFRNIEFPMLAIDRTSGVLWVTLNDGRNFAVPDLEASDGQYHFADILAAVPSTAERPGRRRFL